MYQPCFSDVGFSSCWTSLITPLYVVGAGERQKETQMNTWQATGTIRLITSSARTQGIWHKVRCKVQGARDSCRLVSNYSHLRLLSVTDQENKTVWKTKRAKTRQPRVNCNQASFQHHQLHWKPWFEWRPLMEYLHVLTRNSSIFFWVVSSSNHIKYPYNTPSIASKNQIFMIVFSCEIY